MIIGMNGMVIKKLTIESIRTMKNESLININLKYSKNLKKIYKWNLNLSYIYFKKILNYLNNVLGKFYSVFYM